MTVKEEVIECWCEAEDMICNRCDYRANPEDYADFTEKELVINGLWQGFGGGLDEEEAA